MILVVMFIVDENELGITHKDKEHITIDVVVISQNIRGDM